MISDEIRAKDPTIWYSGVIKLWIQFGAERSEKQIEYIRSYELRFEDIKRDIKKKMSFNSTHLRNMFHFAVFWKILGY